MRIKMITVKLFYNKGLIYETCITKAVREIQPHITPLIPFIPGLSSKQLRSDKDNEEIFVYQGTSRNRVAKI